MHQTVIGQEALEQRAIAEDYPDHVIGCLEVEAASRARLFKK